MQFARQYLDVYRHVRHQELLRCLDTVAVPWAIHIVPPRNPRGAPEPPHLFELR
jgi:hypothetical protein